MVSALVTTAIYISLGWLAGVYVPNYFQAKSKGVLKANNPEFTEVEDDNESDDESDDEDEVDEQHDSDSGDDILEECKMILGARTDLGMKKGKVAAQCGHASLGGYLKILKKANPRHLKYLNTWMQGHYAKICVKIQSPEQMKSIRAAAIQAGLPVYVVTDAGRTQIKSGSQTVLCIGPGPKSLVDTVTGKLKLM